MRVIISGASGLLGTALTRALRSAGHETVALVRRAPRAGEVQWDAYKPLDPAKLAGCDAVVHLAGKNIAGRWTEEFKREVLESRSITTKILATAAAESFRRTGQPRVFVSASGIGYYGNRGEEVLTEESRAGTGFLAEVCKQWEAATAPAREAGVRVVSLRIGVVLARDGGALKPMLLPFQLGLGGRIGSGQQWWSWIELDDVIGAMLFALENDSLQGAVNAVAPAAARNSEFVKALGRALHRPTIFPLPEFVIRTVMGQMGEELLLTSAQALPRKLEDAGYAFRHPQLDEALRAALEP
jgi:uncharacterized protein (TIGR01777 family)